VSRLLYHFSADMGAATIVILRHIIANCRHFKRRTRVRVEYYTLACGYTHANMKVRPDTDVLDKLKNCKKRKSQISQLNNLTL
jgi:hypothetical protein